MSPQTVGDTCSVKDNHITFLLSQDWRGAVPRMLKPRHWIQILQFCGFINYQAVRHEASCLTSLNFSCLICKMRTIILSSGGCCRREVLLKGLGHYCKLANPPVLRAFRAAVPAVCGAGTQAALTNCSHAAPFSSTTIADFTRTHGES